MSRKVFLGKHEQPNQGTALSVLKASGHLGRSAREPVRIGRYEILIKIAEGGMAEVFLAREHGPRGFRRAVVIKRIRPELAHIQSFVDMFLDEAQAVASLNHPNIVQIIDFRDDDGLYMVMEYLEGESLASLHRRHLTRLGRGLDPAIIAHIVAEVAAALEAAHTFEGHSSNASGSIVHRDVAPGNIFVTYSGRIKLLDFGIAWTDDRIAHTEAGQIKGKYPYMSPEQARAQRIDGRSDLFSLGIVAYELATSERLFHLSSVYETLQAVCEAPIAPPSILAPELPPSLESLILRALQRDLRTRYQTARTMREDATKVRDRLLKDQPEQVLARLMSQLFAHRIAQRRDVMARVSTDGSVSNTAVEGLYSTEERSTGGDRSAAMADGTVAVPRWLLMAASSLLLVSSMLIGIYVFRGSGNAAKPVEIRVASAAPQPKRPPADPAVMTTTEVVMDEAGPQRPKDVRIEIHSVPRGATVLNNGRRIGTTPHVLSLPASDQPVTLELQKKGYVSLSREVTPSKDATIKLSLSPKKDAAKKRTSRRARQAPTPSESWEYERFD